MKEEITFNEDGSGSYVISNDMIPTIRKIVSKTTLAPRKENGEHDSVAYWQAVENRAWKDYPSEVDSTIDVMARIPAEIKNDPEKKAFISRFHTFMRGSREKGYMLMGAELQFKDEKDLEEIFDFMNIASKDNPKMNAAMGTTSTKNKITTTKFYRRTTRTKPMNEDDPSAALAKKMLGEMKSLTVLNFKRKIKKVKVKGYTVVEQTDHSITLQIDPFATLEVGGEATIDIKLE
jgi:hypothetical protein